MTKISVTLMEMRQTGKKLFSNYIWKVATCSFINEHTYCKKNLLQYLDSADWCVLDFLHSHSFLRNLFLFHTNCVCNVGKKHHQCFYRQKGHRWVISEFFFLQFWVNSAFKTNSSITGPAQCFWSRQRKAPLVSWCSTATPTPHLPSATCWSSARLEPWRCTTRRENTVGQYVGREMTTFSQTGKHTQ